MLILEIRKWKLFSLEEPTFIPTVFNKIRRFDETIRLGILFPLVGKLGWKPTLYRPFHIEHAHEAYPDYEDQKWSETVVELIDGITTIVFMSDKFEEISGKKI